MKKVLLGAVSVLTAVTLVACTTGKSEKPAAETDTKQEQQVAEFEGVYAHLKKAKNELWYYIDTDENFVEKDNEVKAIFLFNKGNIQAYSLPDKMTIGELSKMKDKEILAKLSEWYKQSKQEALDAQNSKLLAQEEEYDTLVNSGKTAGDYEIEDENPFEELPKEIEKTTKIIERIEVELDEDAPIQKLKVSMETDSTGNQALYQTLTYINANYWYNTTKEEIESGAAETYTYRETLEFNIFPSAVIYDATYRGIAWENDDFESDDFLLTRAEVNFQFDSVDTKGITVD